MTNGAQRGEEIFGRAKAGCEMQQLLILGAGAFAQDVADMALEDRSFQLVAFVQDVDPERCKVTLSGRPVIYIDDVSRLADSCVGICAVGATARSTFVHAAAQRGLHFINLVHTSAQISSSSRLEPGALVSRGTIVAAHSVIGPHVIVNRGCLIGHHVTIAEFCTIAPGVNIAGGVTLGPACYVGMGAVILDKIRIGKGAVIGAGAVVTRHVPDCVEVMGIPARVVKEVNALT